MRVLVSVGNRQQKGALEAVNFGQSLLHSFPHIVSKDSFLLPEHQACAGWWPDRAHGRCGLWGHSFGERFKLTPGHTAAWAKHLAPGIEGIDDHFLEGQRNEHLKQCPGLQRNTRCVWVPV